MRSRILVGLLALLAVLLSGLDAQVVIGRDGRMPGVRRWHYSSVDGPALLRAARSGNSIPIQIAGQIHQLKLEWNDMRAPGYRATVIGPEGEHEIAVPAPATYKGKLDGDPSTEVRFTITDRGVRGFAAFGKSWYFIEPTSTQAGQPVQHVEYSAADADALPQAYNDVIMSGLGGPIPQAASASPASTNSPLTATIILDADAEFYNLDPVNWTTSQQAVLNDVEGIYAAELNVQFRMRLQTVHTNAADFTGTTVCSGSGQDLIVQLNNYWSGRQEGRELVHMFSGKKFSGSTIGCTYEPSIGNNLYSAGLTQQISSGSSSYTATALQKALVVSHEIGHAFNADHNFASTSFDSACNCNDDTIMTAIFMGTDIIPGGHRVVNHFSDANKTRMTSESGMVLCSIPAGSAIAGTASNAFEDKYQTGGARPVFGCATDSAHASFAGNLQDFSGGSDGTGAILMGTGMTAANWLHGPIWTYYSGNGGPGRAFADGSLLGYPTQDPAAAAPSSISGSAVLRGIFQNGQVILYSSGARAGQSYAVRGSILSKWTAGLNLLGMPVAEEASAAVSPLGTTGRTQSFESGQIYWHTSGTRNGSSFYVDAAIATRYASLGGSSSPLGFPVSDEYAWAGGTRNDFEGGYISNISSTINVVLTPETISKPAITGGPSSGLTGTSYTFSASGAVSSKSNPVRYRIFFGDGTDSGWLAAGVLTAPKSWGTAGSYNVTAQAATVDLSIMSPVSDPLTVTIAAPLVAPVLNSPADGAAGLSTSTVLTWNAVAGSASYSVYFGTANPPPLVLLTAATTYSPSLAAGTTYYWTVASRDPNNGNAEARASVRSFTTASAAVTISFNSTPAGDVITFDGTPATTPFTKSLSPGAHTVSTSGLYSGSTGIQYVFNSWADGQNTTSRTITVVAGQPTTYTANYTTQYQLTLAASPAAGGSVAPASGSFYNAGTLVSVVASAASGYIFASWSGAVASTSSASTNITLNAPQTVTANFASLTGISFQTNPPGLPVTVDGNAQIAPFSLQLSPGTHSISVSSLISSGATRYVWSGWSDSGAASHSITVTAGQVATLLATFSTQYQLTVAASPGQGGSVSPSGSAFYNSGTPVALVASPASGYAFSSWSGGVLSASSASTSITLSAPQSVTANFSPVSVSVSTSVFVRQLFRDLLNREPDSAGLSFWVNQIDSGATTRSQAAAQFFTSPEFSSAGLYIIKLYLAVLGRQPDFSGWQYWFNQINSGQPSEVALASFLTSPEFVNKYGSLSDSDFITLVYRSVLGRDPDSGGLQNYVGLLSTHQLSRAAVFDQFVRSPEYGARVSSQAYGNLLYMGFLRRSAETAGLAFWVNSLSSGLPLPEAVKSFIESPEYITRLSLIAP